MCVCILEAFVRSHCREHSAVSCATLKVREVYQDSPILILLHQQQRTFQSLQSFLKFHQLPVFQDGLKSGPFASTQPRGSKTRFYVVEECSECIDLDRTTLQGSYKRRIGRSVLCRASYVGKNVRQKVQVHMNRLNVLRYFFDRSPEVTEPLDIFSQLNRERHHRYTARGGR